MKMMKKMMIIPIMIHDHYCITICVQYDENDENEDKQEDDFDPQRTKWLCSNHRTRRCSSRNPVFAVHIKAATEAKIYHPQWFSWKASEKKQDLNKLVRAGEIMDFQCVKQMSEGMIFGLHLVCIKQPDRRQTVHLNHNLIRGVSRSAVKTMMENPFQIS